MEENKNKEINSLVGLLIIVLVVIIIGLIIYIVYKPDNNYNTVNNNDNLEGDVVNGNQSNEGSNTNNNVITSDHITNDKVQEIYDMVKIDLDLPDKIKYYEDGFFDSLNNKINILLSYQNCSKEKLTNEQISYLNSIITDEQIAEEFGYIKTEELINKLYEIYNIKITKNELYSIEKNNSYIYGIWNELRYSDKIDGFVSIAWGTGTDSVLHNEIYNYNETSTSAIVDTLVGVRTFNYQTSGEDMCNLYDLNNPIYKNIDINTFKFSEEDEDKFTKIRYTFTKRDDGSYYASDIRKIN